MLQSDTQLFVFRHGQTDWNQEGRFQGHTDVPLNLTGIAQAQALVPLLQDRGMERIVSSDLSRARETALIVASALGIPVDIDSRLREAHLGQAQGLTLPEIEGKLGKDVVTRWRSSAVTDADVRYVGGETGREVLARTLQAIDDLVTATDRAQRIGISTHGGVIRRLMHHLLPERKDPVPIPNGVLYVLGYDLRSRRWFVVQPEEIP